MTARADIELQSGDERLAAWLRIAGGAARHYPYGHFDIYADPQARADQVAFLQRVLGEGSA